ncbi:MAG: PASTA domain-containing protein [Propionibacteriales bacterium]|nr:PASTA domain-containing protein [Propionibacteriales bacterium]
MPKRPRRTRNSAGAAQQIAVILGVSVLSGVLIAGLALPWAGLLSVSSHQAEDMVLNDLPLKLDTEPASERTVIRASGGRRLATVYDQNRVELKSLKAVSDVMEAAIIAIEDSRFYEHGALDIKGTIRALVANQSEGDIVQGGSSITQQLVKMTLIEQAENREEYLAAIDDTYARKIKELRYALGVEEEKTKKEILLDYLNIAYFGDGTYGIEAAAQHFFGVPARELNLRQSAALAGMVQNPSTFDPTNNPKKTLQRRDVVLNRMSELGVIEPATAKKVSKRSLGLDIHRIRNGCVGSAAEFFCDYVISWLRTQKTLGATPDDRMRLILRGGLTINTTLDLRHQRAALRAVNDHVFPQEQAIGALATVEPGTGKVTAIAQSRPMGNNLAAGESYVNYLTPPEYTISSGFQPGSTFKAFVLASAVEKGFRMNEVIYSPESLSIPVSDYRNCGGPIKSTETWDVATSTSSGPMNMYTGTQQSVNTYYAQLELKTGICHPWRLAQQMGVDFPKTGPTNVRGQVASFPLGVSDVSPVEMAEAYATFAARGRHCDAVPVVRVLDRDGNPLKIQDGNCSQVIKPSTADAVNDVLRGVIAPGGFADDSALNQPAAGKTGTTQEGKAVWFMGYTPNLVGAAMIAGADGSGQPIQLGGQPVGGTTAYEVSGSGFAAPMWADAMRVIEQWLPDRDFTRPSAKLVKGVPAQVPEVAGMTPKEAEKRLERAGFVPFVQRDYMVNSTYPYGSVAFTSPAGVTSAYTGDTVTVFISNGTPPPPPDPDPKPGNGGGNGGDGDGGGGDGDGDGGDGGDGGGGDGDGGDGGGGDGDGRGGGGGNGGNGGNGGRGGGGG